MFIFTIIQYKKTPQTINSVLHLTTSSRIFPLIFTKTSYRHQQDPHSSTQITGITEKHEMRLLSNKFGTTHFRVILIPSVTAVSLLWAKTSLSDFTKHDKQHNHSKPNKQLIQ